MEHHRLGHGVSLSACPCAALERQKNMRRGGLPCLGTPAFTLGRPSLACGMANLPLLGRMSLKDSGVGPRIFCSVLSSILTMESQCIVGVCLSFSPDSIGFSGKVTSH